MATGSSKNGFMAKMNKGTNSTPKSKVGAGMAPSSPSGPRAGGAKGPANRKSRAKQ